MKNRIVTCAVLLGLVGLGIHNPLLAKDVREKIEEKIRKAEDKVKGAVESLSKGLQSAVDKAGDNIEAIQNYFDTYQWQGVVENQATSGVATLGDLKLNGHSRAVVAKPGEEVIAQVNCALDPSLCKPFSYYRVVVGLKGVGPQTTVGNALGLVAGQTVESFALKAPAQPGLYEIRFRVMERYAQEDALRGWYDERGQEPDSCTTLGFLYVKA